VEFADVSGTGADSAKVNAFLMRVLTSTGFTDFTFHKEIDTFNLTVGLKDGASGASGFLTFKGSVDGTLYGAQTGSVLKVAFASPTNQSLVLGQHQYAVSLAPFTFNYQGTDNGFSPYQPVPMSVQVSDVPEPSTLALAAVGLAAVGWRAWRRRKGLAGAV
jgi:hypothetical protein